MKLKFGRNGLIDTAFELLSGLMALSVTCCPLNPNNPLPTESTALNTLGDRVNLIDSRFWNAIRARSHDHDNDIDDANVAMPQSMPRVQAELYTNPVWEESFGDPSVMSNGKDYYVYGSAGMQDNGLWFPCLRSANLTQWNYLGGSLQPIKEQFARQYWAPSVVAHSGKYYMYYSTGGSAGEHHQIRVAIADKPAGPFADQGKVLIPAESFSSDAHPFLDPKSGKWYLFFTRNDLHGLHPGTAIAMVELSPDMQSVKGDVKPVVSPSSDWQLSEQNHHWQGRYWKSWYALSGPTVVFRNGHYYCFYSGGIWTSKHYGVGFAHADSIDGPWTDDQDAHNAAVLSPQPDHVLGPGHNCIAKAPDGVTDVFIYHAWDPARAELHLCVDRVEWTNKGPHCQPTWQPTTLYGNLP